MTDLLPDTPGVFIGGRWVDVASTRSVLDPADESVVSEVAEAEVAHADRAVDVAREAQPDWARRTGVERGAVLRSVAARIRDHAGELATLVVREQGKTITEARGEIEASAGWFEYCAGFERRQTGAVMASDNREEQLIVREEPYGVVVAIVPWNFPAALFARKVAPAIMAGNAIVLKPHEETPLAALALARVCSDAGVPDGVVNVVTGAGTIVGDALVRNPSSGLVTVTGSTRAGREILAAAADTITPVSLELGGKAPFIVAADADLDRAVTDAVAARLWNCGQVCTCNERTYVHRSLYYEFVERFVDAARKVRIGPPLSEDSELGPKVSAAEWTKVKEYVDDAVRHGARVATGGGRPAGAEFTKGHWFEPTVLTDVTDDMGVVRDEVFGPVLPILPFDDFDDAVRRANDTRYGLTAYVYTADLRQAMRAVDAISFGEVYVNKVGPEQLQGFHTGWGASGIDGDDGEHGFRKYLRKKTVYLSYA